MKQTKEDAVSLNLRPDDIATIVQVAEDDRRTVTSVLRNMLEDIVDGTIPIAVKGEPKVKRKTALVRVEPAFKARFEAFKEATNLSADKIVEQALKVIREQRAARDRQEA